MSQDNKGVYQQSVIEMLTVSAEYCIMMEKLGTSGTTRSQFLGQITKVLPLIYVKASLLPVLEESGFGEPQEIVTEEDYEEVRQHIWRLLKADDEYLEVFTPDMQYSEGAMTRTISEDLADIYQDLKNFVAIFADRNEEAMAEAVIKVKENFAMYWGQRLVNAMRPLHELTYSGKADEEEDTDREETED